jgi:predicted acylesterase/phospholipase RssA
MTKEKDTALILAGAAGKGPFAAGALSEIARRTDFNVRCIVGTSSGALNGALYAAGLRVGDAEGAANACKSSGAAKRNGSES